MHRLLSFEELGAGKEHKVLPAVVEATRSRYRRFPVESEALRPVSCRPLDQKLPRFSVFEFRDLAIHGFRMLELQGCYFNDQSIVCNDDSAHNYFTRKFEAGAVEDLVAGPAGYTSSAGRYADATIDSVLVLSSDEPSNFGAWIYRILTKYLLACRAGFDLPVFVNAPAPWMLDVLRLVKPDVAVIQQQPRTSYRLRHAFVPSLPAPGAFFRDELRAAIGELAERTAASGQESAGGIYVSRRKQAIKRPGFRVLLNETELVERLRGQGYIEYFPEDHAIADQISTFSRARRIVCSGGSGLFGTYFARNTETIIDLEASETWAHAHLNVMSSTNAAFSMLRGKQVSVGTSAHLNWTVDVDTFLEGLAIADS